MKKILSVVSMSIAVSLGVASCQSFSSGAGSGGSTGSSSTGGSTGSSDTGGSTVTPGSGGATTAETGGSTGSDTGGSTGTPGSGGSTVTPGSGGSTVTPGSGGSTVARSGGATGSGGAARSGGATGSGGAVAAFVGPCDVLAAANNPCVAAHSTTRALYGSYTGPLYQVCRGASAPGPNSCPGGMVMDIGVIAGGYANAAAQDTFCAGAVCTIATIYDQSPNGNFLKPAPRGGAKPTPDNPAVATDLRIMLNGHPVYGVFIKNGMGYRAGCTGCGTPTPRGTAIGDQPESMYMITSQNGKQPGLSEGCCFDYGNAETTSNDDGNGTMEALYYGGGVVWGTGSPGGHANGPWIMADLENGLYAGWENGQDQNISTNTVLRMNFVTGVLVGDVAARNAGAGRFALYGGDATTGTLRTLYDGIRPQKAGYVPMRKQGSIILGIGGDNSSTRNDGQWFEGAMTSGAATIAAVNALQANIVAAGYGR